MANDVFGRPMNDQPTSFPVNRRPLAPNPMAGPQDEPFSGMRGPGDEGTSRPSSEEFMGAVYGITGSRPGTQDDGGYQWPSGSPGGKVMGSAVPYQPMPLDDRAMEP